MGLVKQWIQTFILLVLELVILSILLTALGKFNQQTFTSIVAVNATALALFALVSKKDN